jgi:hypothetical protein
MVAVIAATGVRAAIGEIAVTAARAVNAAIRRPTMPVMCPIS